MLEFEFEIVETLKKKVKISAPDPLKARELVIRRYWNAEIVLSSDDYYETEFIDL